ncbi:MAG: OmpA family protein [Candidatus Kapabacteria bacterium]|nr:OmpA family protein [Candidatus Kapabacteria bacterium]MDW8225613.1 OmpA family protein [Bacteroidota bacterium]
MRYLYVLFALLFVVLGCQRPPTIERFEAVPPEITAGESTVLVWQVRNADSVEIPGVATGLGKSGTLRQRLFSGQYFVLRAQRGTASAERLISVIVHPRAVEPDAASLSASQRPAQSIPQEPASQQPVQQQPSVPAPAVSSAQARTPTIRLFRLIPAEPMEGEWAIVQWDVEGADSVELVGISRPLGSAGGLWYPVYQGQQLILRAYAAGSYVERVLIPEVRLDRVSGRNVGGKEEMDRGDMKPPVIKGAPQRSEHSGGEFDGCLPGSEGRGAADLTERLPDMLIRRTEEGYVLQLRDRFGEAYIRLVPPHHLSLQKLVEELRRLAGAIAPEYGMPQRVVAHFDPGSSVILPEYEAAIADWARYLQRHSHIRVEVRGHTDQTGVERLNRRLGQERAEWVRRLLISYGVSPLRIVARSYGSSRPLWNPELYEWHRRENRRVEIVVLP